MDLVLADRQPMRPRSRSTEAVRMSKPVRIRQRAYAAANLYVRLPAQVQQLASTMLQQVTGPGGTQLLS
jgi:hypothetical protein